MIKERRIWCVFFQLRLKIKFRPLIDASRFLPQVSIENDGKSFFSTLEITTVAAEDAGKYKVTAKNELGESNATINLNFDSNSI
jgi:hypothetical protein